MVFEGKTASECEIHILGPKGGPGGRKAQRRRADDHIRHSCFQGDALRWHADLDPEVQHDWKRLQQALIRRYINTTETPVGLIGSVIQFIDTRTSGFNLPYQRGRCSKGGAPCASFLAGKRFMDAGLRRWYCRSIAAFDGTPAAGFSGPLVRSTKQSVRPGKTTLKKVQVWRSNQLEPLSSAATTHHGTV